MNKKRPTRVIPVERPWDMKIMYRPQYQWRFLWIFSGWNCWYWTVTIRPTNQAEEIQVLPVEYSTEAEAHRYIKKTANAE